MWITGDASNRESNDIVMIISPIIKTRKIYTRVLQKAQKEYVGGLFSSTLHIITDKKL